MRRSRHSRLERIAWRGPLLVLLALLWPLTARAQVPRWQVGLVPGLLSGTYGVDARTDIWYAPLTIRRLFDAGDVTVVLPYMCIRGDDDITVVAGTPVRTSATTDARAGRPTAPSTPSRTERPGASGSGGPVPATSRSTCGLGDVVLRGRYYVLDQDAWWPTIAVRAQAKVPTADEAKGLGTGRPDQGIGVEVSRSMGQRVLLMVDGGYTKIGQPADRHFRNRWWYDVGLARTVVADRLDVAVFLEHYRSIVEGRPDARGLLGVVTLRGAGRWHVQMSGQVGLSAGAPDVGLTVGATSRF